MEEIQYKCRIALAAPVLDLGFYTKKATTLCVAALINHINNVYY